MTAFYPLRDHNEHHITLLNIHICIAADEVCGTERNIPLLIGSTGIIALRVKKLLLYIFKNIFIEFYIPVYSSFPDGSLTY